MVKFLVPGPKVVAKTQGSPREGDVGVWNLLIHNVMSCKNHMNGRALAVHLCNHVTVVKKMTVPSKHPTEQKILIHI